MEFVLALLAVPVLWFLININHWYYLRQVLQQHSVYLAGVTKGATKEQKELSEKAARWITANQTEFQRQVKKAGVHAPQKTYVKAMGLGFAGQQTVDALDNLLFLNAEFLQGARDTLEIAKGHYLNGSSRNRVGKKIAKNA